MGMRNSAREEDEPAGRETELRVAALHDVFAFEDVEDLILVRMDVTRGVEERGTLFEDRECAAVVSLDALMRTVTSPNTRRSPSLLASAKGAVG
jgi:hypothetical protein